MNNRDCQTQNATLIMFIAFLVIIVATLQSGSKYSVASAPPRGNRIYYISPEGADSNNGLSPQAAWQTISRVNAHKPQPGESFLFQAGKRWNETLIITESGGQISPIRYASYGQGEKPRIENVYDLYGDSYLSRYSLLTLNDGSFESGINNYSVVGKYSLIADGAYHGSKCLQLAPSSTVAFNVYCRASKYRLRIFANSPTRSEINIKISEKNKFLQNKNLNNVYSDFGSSSNGIPFVVEGTNWREVRLTWERTDPTPGMIRVEICNTSRNFIKIDALRLEPMWERDVVARDVYKIDALPVCTEMLTNGERISRYDDFKNLKDNSYTYTQGVWYLKHLGGDPDLSNVRPQVVKANSNAVKIFNAKNIVIENLEINGNAGVNGNLGSLSVYNSEDIVISNCKIKNSSTGSLLVNFGKNIQVVGCSVSGGGTGGIYFYNSSNCKISNNDSFDNGNCFHDFTDLHGIGIGYWSKSIVVEKNFVWNNGYGGGAPYKGAPAVTLYSASDSIVKDNVIFKNWRGGITVDSGHQGNSDNTVVENNLIISNGLIGKYGYHAALSVQAHQPASSNNIRFENNTIIDHQGGSLWRFAIANVSGVIPVDSEFTGQGFRGKIVAHKGGDLKAIIEDGKIVLPSAIRGKTGWSAIVIKASSSPATVMIMSPKEISGLIFRRNIVYNSQGALDIAIGDNVKVTLSENCYWRTNSKFIGYILSKQPVGWDIYKTSETHSFFKDPKLANMSRGVDFAPTQEGFNSIGARVTIPADSPRWKLLRSIVTP